MTVFNRFLILLLNYIPFFLFCGAVLSIWKLHDNIPLMFSVLILIIYIIPPLISRTVLFICPLKKTEYELFSKEYFVWAASFFSQMIYLRFPFLEEILRAVPGLYSFWLRVFWGAKIGRLTFWAPGTKILDRPFLNIGNNVIFTAGVKLNPHAQLNRKLIIAPVTIEDNVMIGAYSLILAGTVIKSNQETKPFLKSAPFTILENGAKVKIAD